MMKLRASSKANAPDTAATSGVLQRACACGNHTSGGGECEECRKKREGTLQRAAISSAPLGDAAPIVYEVLGSPGQRLDAATRAFMEPRFGHDFSRIPSHGPVAGAIQTKLAINNPGDEYEQEADRVADQVVAGPPPAAVRGASAHIQRFAGQSAGRADSVPASVDRALANPGSPLEPTLRQEMEQRFDHDFSRVRVHSGAAAAQSARDVNAHAYTVGHSIVFGTDQFNPGTQRGRRLIAHELTHVVQQSGAERMAVGQNNDKPGPSPIPHRLHGAPPAIQRDDAGGGSTAFQDQVTVYSRPGHGPGVHEGTVTRTETAPASGSLPQQVIHTGEMHIRFDPSDCSITIPFGYNFVQAAQSGSAGFCDDPPPSTPVALLPADRMNRLKASVLAEVNHGLNGWFDVRLTGGSCPSGCANRALPIRVDAHEDTAHPDTTITVVNRAGRANSATICAGSWDPSTAVHEAGHQVLGVGDEYPEEDERLRATVPQWFRSERVRHDYSAMGPEEHSRFAMFHERHFNAVKTFLEYAFPGCTATLQARPRPVIPDFRLDFGTGYASLSGTSGIFFEAGLRVGIPLDRLRRWEVVLGPQFNVMLGTGDLRSQNAFLLGARLGLEGSTGGGGFGFTAGVFGEAGHGWFSSNDYRLGGGGSRSATGAYGEIGLGAGLRTPILAGSTRFDFRLEGAAGSRIGGPGIIGPMTREVESDPALSHWFRLGLTIGTHF